MNGRFPFFRQTFELIISVLVIVVIVLAAVRIAMTPVYLELEYRMPYFPEDPYGFSRADRLYWSRSALEYIKNDAEISFLSELRFSDGTPLYNERELSHMIDVQTLVHQTWLLLIYGFILLMVAGALAYYTHQWSLYKAAVARGGQWTMIAVMALLTFILLSFNQLFTQFHRIFFEGDTWLFYTSDTLIRLFPVRFWQDIFILVGLLTLGGGYLIMRLFRPKKSGIMHRI